MKKENTKRLLTEMIDREFEIEEIADVFSEVDYYLTERRAWFKETDPQYKAIHKKSTERYAKWLKEKLEQYSLEYSIEEIIE